jgi:hypothetical protein
MFWIRKEEIHQLSSMDAVTGLFPASGYDAGLHIPQTPTAMIFPKSLVRRLPGCSYIDNVSLCFFTTADTKDHEGRTVFSYLCVP